MRLWPLMSVVLSFAQMFLPCLRPSFICALSCPLPAASGDSNLVTNPVKLSLYGVHADWSEPMISFCESMYSSEISGCLGLFLVAVYNAVVSWNLVL